MRRQVVRKESGRRKSKNREPLVECMQIIEVPIDKHGRRMWRRLTGDELIVYAKQVMEMNGITEKGELQKFDVGLDLALRRRGLMGEIVFEETHVKWREMNDDEIVVYAQRFMRENGITGKTELIKTKPGIYRILRNSGLLDKVGFVPKKKQWKEMDDDEIVAYAVKWMQKEGVKTRGELQNKYNKLYKVLRKRNLLDEIDFECTSRNWGKKSNDEILAITRRFMKKNGIKSRTELAKSDHGLYLILRKRGLLGKVGFKGKKRNFKDMDDDRFVAYAQNIIEKHGIRRIIDLQRLDGSVYNALRKRGLVAKTFAEIDAQKREVDDGQAAEEMLVAAQAM